MYEGMGYGDQDTYEGMGYDEGPDDVYGESLSVRMYVRMYIAGESLSVRMYVRMYIAGESLSVRMYVHSMRASVGYVS